MRINIPPITRALLLSTIFFTVLYALARWNALSQNAGDAVPAFSPSIPFLTLVPSMSVYYPWTIVTSTFVEQNVLNLLINTTAVYLSGKYLERAWGSRDFATIVVVATVVPNLLVIFTYVLWAVVTRNTTRADTPIAGAISLQAAFLVAFKNLVPEHTVSLYKGTIKVRVKHFPFIFLILNTFSGIVFGTDTALLLGWYGLISTFIYLRFFKYQSEVGTKGDASETFAFATFFPNVIQPFVSIFCDYIYNLACQLKIISPFSDEAIASSNEQATAREGGLPVAINQNRVAKLASKQEEVERRRQLALKALDERLRNPASSHDPTPDSTSTVPAAPPSEQPSK
ncbi:hypothetical protein LTR05_003669 [Lithohypha guttulata]|uniref:Rhomboid family protein n=1 Tax=Lithohypha guttulata TaxID=1690604 RepID=A0AAN7T0D4_9EURO|nr:hypothetical protein LTR05_003669 [Lithohypha guttulata]